MRKIALKLLAGVVIGAAGAFIWRMEPLPARAAAPAPMQPAVFVPPPEHDIPEGKFGDMVRLGEKIFREPATYAAAYVGNDLRCSNCHLEAGRLAGAAPMGAAYVAFPAYRAKNGHVNSFEERLQGCFRYSMNGKVPPLGDPVLVALESYSFFLARGLPTGEPAPGRGFPELPKPPLPADYARGGEVYAQQCAACHGADGHGQSSGGKVVFPPLWGPRSYNWGAGMTSIKSAAEFIHANMPLGLAGTLSVQQAWDLAAYIDSQVRPQDPRYTGDVAETRKKHHDTPFSMYGRTVNGALLGDPASTPPAGTVPAKPN
jgi:thiosulfate dehydrogenase